MKRLIATLIAAAALIACLALAGCADSGDNGKTNDGPAVDVVTKGGSDYVIVRSENVSASERTLIADFRNEIRMTTTATVDLISDTEAIPEGKYAFYIGDSSLEAASRALSGVGENSFRFLMKDKTLIIATNNAECMKLALNTFKSEYLTSEGIKVPASLDRTWQCEKEITTREVTNPINPGGNDPDVVYHDGYYYYCWSAGTGVMVSRAESLDKISSERGNRVYSAPSDTMYSGEYWAPELHYIQGEWYIYVAADNGQDVNHRMYVLKGKTQDPTKSFEFVGQITDPSNKWAIDGTVVTIKDELYFVWSGWNGDNDGGNQRIYIAHMSDPCTIDSNRVQLSAHENSWEGGVNEGPYGVEIDGVTYIIYSANGSWADDYCLAYLKLEPGADPLKARSWTKSISPILSKSKVAYGPGHASIVKLDDGSYWMVYHANLESGTGWNGRSVWIQPLTFKANGDIKPQTPKKTVDFPVVKWVVKGEV